MISCRWIAAAYCSGLSELLVFNHCRTSEWLVLDFFVDDRLRGKRWVGRDGFMIRPLIQRQISLFE